MNLRRILLTAQGAEGNGDGDGTPAASATPPPPVVDPTEGFKKLLEKHNNDAIKVAEKLYDENHSLRGKVRDLSAKVPGDGSLVLGGDDLKTFEAWKGLGKKPDEIKTIIDEHQQFKSADARRTVEALHQQYADISGFKASVLTTLLDKANIEIEIQEPKAADGNPLKGRDGQPLKVVVVKGEDPHDKRKSLFTPLPDYAKKHWSDFLPALTAKEPQRSFGTPSVGRGNEPPPTPPNQPATGGKFHRSSPL